MAGGGPLPQKITNYDTRIHQLLQGQQEPI